VSWVGWAEQLNRCSTECGATPHSGQTSDTPVVMRAMYEFIISRSKCRYFMQLSLDLRLFGLKIELAHRLLLAWEMFTSILVSLYLFVFLSYDQLKKYATCPKIVLHFFPNNSLMTCLQLAALRKQLHLPLRLISSATILCKIWKLLLIWLFRNVEKKYSIQQFWQVIPPTFQTNISKIMLPVWQVGHN